LTNKSKNKKTPACNEQFGASGGADSSDTEQVTASFALVRALPIPPPAAKLPPRCAQPPDSAAGTVQRKFETRKLNIK